MDDPEARVKSSLSDCTWLEDLSMDLSSRHLKTYEAKKNRGASLLFFTFILFFLLIFSLSLSFFFFLSLLFFSSHYNFFSFFIFSFAPQNFCNIIIT
jgi:hypothetical protein